MAHAHDFFICQSKEALEEALAFHGFSNSELIIQEYVEHLEQVYKLYTVGANFYAVDVR